MTSWRKLARVAGSVEELLPRLQERDLLIVMLLGRYRVFTLVQLAGLYFTSTSSARDRVNTLVELGVLRRFRPASTRAAFRYMLSHMGRCLYLTCETNRHNFDVAINSEGEVKMPSKRKAEHAVLRLASSTHRCHLEAINDFFVRLILGLRTKTTDTGQMWWLAEWLPESHDGGYGLARPDGAGMIVNPGGQIVRFWFEHDTGTEPLSTLVDKAKRYDDSPLDHRPLLLFQLPSPRRQANFHHALRDRLPQRFYVATTVTGPGTDPTARVWWLCNDTHKRLRGIDRIINARHPNPEDPFDSIQRQPAFDTHPPVPDGEPEPDRERD